LLLLKQIITEFKSRKALSVIVYIFNIFNENQRFFTQLTLHDVHRRS